MTPVIGPRPFAESSAGGMLDIVIDRIVSPRLAGRSAELDALATASREARAGNPAAVFLGGEAGVGKSRLVEEFVARAGADDALTLLGECYQLAGEGAPYLPFTAMLRDLRRELGDTGFAEHAGHGVATLSRLLPELGPAVPADDTAPAQAQLFEHVLLLLESVARVRPLVLVVEDAHWAGASTRDLLLFLVRSLRTAPVLLLVTYRTDELHRSHPLRRLLADLDRVRGVRRLELDRLSRDETRGQLAGILGAEPEPDLVETVHRRTDGNPLFVEEFVCCQCTDTAVLRDAGLTDTLRDLLLSRVEQLPEAGRQVLRVAAVGGTRVDHELLAAVADDDLSDGLRQAVEGNVLVTDARGYRFRHALIQEAVYTDLLPGERGRLHAAYAEVLAADPEAHDRRAMAVARHWYAAFDAERALTSAWAALDVAERVAAHRERLLLLERVLELWDRVPAADLLGVSHLDVLERAVEAASTASEPERGIALATAALREVVPAREPARAAFLLERRAWYQWTAGRDGMADMVEAERLARSAPPGPVLTRVLTAMAKFLMFRPSDEPGLAYAGEAYALAKAQGDTTAAVQALTALGSIEAHLGRVDEGLSRFATARELGADTTPFNPVAANESDLLEAIGEHERAAEVARSALATAVAKGVSRSSFLAANVAEPLIALGQWDEALDLIEADLRMEPTPVARAILLLLRAQVALGRGDVAAAGHTAAVVRAILGTCQPVAQNLMPLAHIEMRLALTDGRLEDALDIGEEMCEHEYLSRSRRYLWPILQVSARAASDLATRAEGLRDEVARRRAQRTCRLVEVHAGRIGAVGSSEEAYRATVQAELARARGVLDRDLWQAAADAWERDKRPFARAWALLRVTESAAGDGDRTVAAEAIAIVRETAERLGARPLQLAAERLAARARLTTAPDEPSPGAAGRLGLTPRELEVLRLVTAGRTNPQIAAELFIATKTVSVHVSRILTKLDVKGRGEAAAAAHRLHLFDGDEATA